MFIFNLSSHPWPWDGKRMIGTNTSWSLTMKCFAWRKKDNERFTQHFDVGPFACFSAELKVPASRNRRRQNNWRQTLLTCHKLWTMNLPHHSSNSIIACTNGMWKGWIYDKWTQGQNDFKWIAKNLRLQWTWSGIKNQTTFVSFYTSWVSLRLVSRLAKPGKGGRRVFHFDSRAILCRLCYPLLIMTPCMLEENLGKSTAQQAKAEAERSTEQEKEWNT